MILGIGVDIVEIDRMRQMLDTSGERLIARIFTEGEARYALARVEPERHRFELGHGLDQARDARDCHVVAQDRDTTPWPDDDVARHPAAECSRSRWKPG